MPDYDLGTAHGRIRLDGDSRGVDGVNRGIDAFERALLAVVGRVATFAGAMDKLERDLKDVQGDFDDASRSADKFDRSLGGLDASTLKASRSTKDLSSNFGELRERFRGVQEAVETTLPPLLKFSQFVQAYRGTSGNVFQNIIDSLEGVSSKSKIANSALQALQRTMQATGGDSNLLRVARAASAVGAGSFAFNMVKARFLGMGAAFQQATPMQRRMVGLSNEMRLFTLAALGATKVVGPLERAFGKIVNGTEGADFAVKGFSDTLRRFVDPVAGFVGALDKIPQGITQSVLGAALFRSGINNMRTSVARLMGPLANLNQSFLGRALKFIFLPGVILSSAATQAFAKSLVAVSNLIDGLGVGLVQLAGGFAAIPGAIGVIGAAALPLVGIIATLKGHFKDLSKAISANDPQKLAEAMAQIPPYLQPLAQMVVDLTPKVKELGDTMAATFVGNDLAGRLRPLADTYLPAVANASILVANSWKNIAAQGIAFMGQGRTMSALNQVFMDASQVLNTVAQNIQPVLVGFRELGTVGAGFIRTLAEDYIPNLATKFGNFATNAATSGRALNWMTGSIQAAKYLTSGMVDLSKAVWTLATLFKTTSGSNFLKDFAADMKKFNDEINKSKASGELGKIANSVKTMGTDKIKELWQMFKDALPAIEAVIHTLSQVGSAFSQIMLPAVQMFLSVFIPLVSAFNSFGGGTIIGTIMGVTGAFRLLMNVLAPLRAAIQIAFGAFNVVSGAQTAILGIQGVLERFGSTGVMLSGKLASVGDTIVGWATKAAGALAILYVAYQSYEQQAQTISDANKSIADSAQHTVDGLQALQAAFYKDNGQAGPNVASVMKQNVDTMLSDLQSAGSKMPGMLGQVTGALGALFTGHATDFIKADFYEDASKKMSDAFGKLGLSSKDLAAIIQGTQPAFDSTLQELNAMGDGGRLAGQKLQLMRQDFMDSKAAMEAAAPGAAQLAAGLQQIQSSAGNADQVLQGLKTSLEALGLLQQTGFEAAAAYAKDIDGLGDALKKAADDTQPFNDIIDKTTGFLNPLSANARNLESVLAPMAESFLNAAAHGQDVNQMWSAMQGHIQEIADAFHLLPDQLNQVLQQMGMDPKIVKILVQLQGKDDITRELAQVIATAQQNLNNSKPIQIPIGADASKIAGEVNNALGLGGKANAVTTTPGGNVVLGTGINQQAIDTLAQILARNHGIDLNGPGPVGPKGGPPIPLPNQPAPGPVMAAPGAPPPDKGAKGPATPPGQPAPQKAAVLPPGMPEPTLPPNMVLPGPKKPPAGPTLASAIAPLDPNNPPPAAPAPAAPAPAAPAPAPAPPPPAPVAPPPAPPVAPAPAPAGPPPGLPPIPANQVVHIQVIVDGLDKANAVIGILGGINNALAQSAAHWAMYQGQVASVVGGITSGVQTMVDSVNQKFSQAAQQTRQAGVAFTNNFAAGINDAGALQRVADAAKQAAQTAANYMPHSPAKEGPLSGQGWSGFSGQAFSEDFAGGVLKGVSNISESVKTAAAAAKIVFAGLTKGVPDDSSKFLGQLKDMEKMAQSFFNVFKGYYDTGKKLIDAFKPQQNQKTIDNNATSVQGAALLGGARDLANIKNPSRDDIVAAIAGEAQQRGYDRNTAIAVLSAAMHESNVDPNSVNASGHTGLFQEQSNYPGAQPGNAAGQIQWMFDQLDALGGPKAVSANPLDTIASQIERGGYTGEALAQHSVAAAKAIDSVSAKVGAVTGAVPDQSNPASAASRVAIAPNVEAGVKAAGLAPLYATSGPNAYQLPSWMNDLAAKFGLTASTYANGGSLHQMGFAADFNGPEAGRRALANYIDQYLRGQTLQLIYQDPSTGQKLGIAGGQNVGPGTAQPGYYADDFGQHTDHVHWATDVAPILSNANANAMGTSQQQQGILDQLRQNNQSLDDVNKNTTQNPTDQRMADSLDSIQSGVNKSNSGDASSDKNTVDAINNVSGTIGNQNQSGGEDQTQSAIGQGTNAIQGANQIVGDVLSDINDFFDAMGATKNSADILVRGIANTGDINKLIDNTQKWITFAAQVAQTVGDVAQTAGNFIPSSAGGADFGGTAAAKEAVQAVSGVADAIAGGLQALNATIDAIQQANQIFGSYFGNFLGYLTGGTNSLQGNVQFLLDQNTGQLLAYSTDNPLDKTGHDIPGQIYNANANNQGIGQINVYGGPGSDPRDNTRQMMYQIKAAGYAAATAQ